MDIVVRFDRNCQWKEIQQLQQSYIKTEPAVWAQFLMWLADNASLAIRWLQQPDSPHADAAELIVILVAMQSHWFSERAAELQARSLALPSYRKMLMQLSSLSATSRDPITLLLVHEHAISAILHRHSVSFIDPDQEKEMALQLMPATMDVLARMTVMLARFAEQMSSQHSIEDGKVRSKNADDVAVARSRLSRAALCAWHCTYLPACDGDSTITEQSETSAEVCCNTDPPDTSSRIIAAGMTQLAAALADGELRAVSSGNSMVEEVENKTSAWADSKHDTSTVAVFLPGLQALVNHPGSFLTLEACLRSVGRSWQLVQAKTDTEVDTVEKLCDIVTAACNADLELPPLQSLVASLTKVLMHGKFCPSALHLSTSHLTSIVE